LPAFSGFIARDGGDYDCSVSKHKRFAISILLVRYEANPMEAA